MKPEQQRIKIAEALRWKRIGPDNPCALWPCSSYVTGIDGFAMMDPTGGSCAKVPPDYLNDLNACHEMEKALTREEHWAYINELVWLTQAEWTDSYDEVFVVVHATAAQRCEAFLKTLGLWVDKEPTS